jgi:hypothetical protein
LGPASRGLDKVEALARAGVDVFRLNFSHGTPIPRLATRPASSCLIPNCWPPCDPASCC